jgi:hypothetical protein
MRLLQRLVVAAYICAFESITLMSQSPAVQISVSRAAAIPFAATASAACG